MSDQETKTALFQLMGQAQKLQQGAERQAQAVENAAQELKRDAQDYKREAVAALTRVASEAMETVLRKPQQQFQAVSDSAQEGANLFRKRAKELLVTTVACSVVIILGCTVVMGLFTGWYLEEKRGELEAIKAELKERNIELARLPKVYDNIQDNPGFWVVIDRTKKIFELQNGEVVARLPRKQ